jgi:DNA-binding CsgD family transcriptional regulator
MPLAAFSKTVTSIFDAVLDERLTPAAVGAVAKFAGAAGATFLRVNKLAGRVSSVVRSGCFTGNRADYLSYYSKIDLFRPMQEEAPSGRLLLQLSECLPQTALRRDEWYNDYVLTGGVCDLLGAKLCESRSHTVIVGLHRAIGDNGPFPGNPKALQALMDPLQSAARLHLGLIEIGYRSAIARGELDDLSAGVIFTDPSGRIIETNTLGEAILRLDDGLTIRGGLICARRSFETAKLASLIANATGDGIAPTAGCMLVGRDRGRPALVVRVAPVSAGQAGYDMPMAMILVSIPAANRISERELSELYGLSPAESRLALALERGKRMSELTADFGVQITTLRTQLSSILKKCDVERQSDLVNLIASIPLLDPAPREKDTV